MEGRIVRGVGGYYYVDSEGREFVCRARGKFRIDDETPVVGDLVRFEAEGSTGYLLEILPRKNILKRPHVANIDQLVIVISSLTPKPDLMLVDKLILSAEMSAIRPILCVNKLDKDKELTREKFCTEFGSACSVIATSAQTGAGIEDLRVMLDHTVSCFAGQSAVGKSSLINALVPGMSLQTGALSKKISRGKHTTRHTTLLSMGQGYILDTPGFSLLETTYCEPEDVASFYPEFRPYLDKCRFAKCQHKSEPGCAVKEALAAGTISPARYARYAAIIDEYNLMRKSKYD